MSVLGMELRIVLSVVLLLVCTVITAATTTEKPVKEAPTTTTTSAPPPPQPQAPSNDMELVDYVRSGALVVAFLATVFAGQDIWLLTNLIVVAAFGAIFYFYPEPWLAYTTRGKLDAVHLYLGQQFGAVLLTLAVLAYFARKSRQEGVRTSVLVSNLLAGLVMLVSMGMDYMKSAGDSQRLSQQAVSFSMLGCALWVLGNFIAVMRAGSFGGSSVSMQSCLSKHLLIDLIFFILISFLNYGYPEIALTNVTLKAYTPDGIHAHLLRSISAIFFGTAIHGFQALSFYDNRDKRVHFLSRVVMYGLVLPVFFLYQWKYQLVSVKAIYVNIAASFIPMANSFLGYFGVPSFSKLKLQ